MNVTQSNTIDDRSPEGTGSLDDQKFFLLVIEARRKGYCTPDDIMRSFPDVERSVEMTERVLDLGIELRTDDSPAAALHAVKIKSRKQLEEVLEQEQMNALGLYFKEMGTVALLSPEDESVLVSKIKKGDQKAFQSLIDANQRLVVSIAKDHISQGAALADLIQEGNMGLMKAAKQYDPHKGGRFSYYAAGFIQKAIKQFLGTRSQEYYVPAHVVESLMVIREAKEELRKELRREPSVEELAVRTRIPAEQLHELFSSSWLPVSLDSHIGDSTGRIVDSLADEDQEHAGEDLVDNELLRERLEEELFVLEEDERQVIRLRYGLSDGREWSIDEIAVFMSRSREEISALSDAAVGHLKEHIEDFDLGALFGN